MAEQWEYKSVLCNGGDDIEATLALLGAHRWEAVGFAPVKFGSFTADPNSMLSPIVGQMAVQYRVLLKRRKP